MTTRTLIATTLAAALFATACEKKAEEAAEAEAPAAQAPAIDVAAEAESIKNRSAEYMNYINAKDGASILSGVLAPDAIQVVGDSVRSGSDAIKKGMEEDFKKMPEAVWSWSSTDIKVASSGDMAVEKGNWYLDPDGPGKKSQTSGTYVTVWEKIDGNWRATTDVAVEKAAEAAESEGEEAATAT
jgi:ketosteroid isomerase-like protein